MHTRYTTPSGHLGIAWNATQYKLDIRQFLDMHFHTFVWMDSGASLRPRAPANKQHVGRRKFGTHVALTRPRRADTLVFDDMTHFLLNFVTQDDKQVYLVRDHAMFDEQFRARWKQIAGPVRG